MKFVCSDHYQDTLAYRECVCQALITCHVCDDDDDRHDDDVGVDGDRVADMELYDVTCKNIEVSTPELSDYIIYVNLISTQVCKVCVNWGL